MKHAHISLVVLATLINCMEAKISRARMMQQREEQKQKEAILQQQKIEAEQVKYIMELEQQAESFSEKKDLARRTYRKMQ